MRKSILFFVALGLAIADSAHAQTYSNNDSNLDGKVDISDVNSVIGEICGTPSSFQVVKAGATASPYEADNSQIIGKWYLTKASYIEFKSDGAVEKVDAGSEWSRVIKDTTKFENKTFRFLPYQGRIILYNANNIPTDFINVYDMCSDYLAIGNRNERVGVVYKTQPSQPVVSITLSKTSLVIQPKSYEQISATVSPSYADDASVTWTSSNTSVATVIDGLILAVADGTATITCSANDGGGANATCEVTVQTDKSGTIDGKEYVDLGLPSGTLWAACNVGANYNEDYGLYFAWGETTGYTSDNSDGHYFDWSSYKYWDSSTSALTKYSSNVDGKKELDASDDATTVNWGSNWQMPSYKQINELINSDYTTQTRTFQNGSNGTLITGRNGNSIFLPAAGTRYGGSLSNAGFEGCYWTRTLDTESGSYAYLLASNYSTYWSSMERFAGLCVRPVRVQK